MKKIDSSGKLPTISFITISKYNSKELVDTINSLLDQINEEKIEYIIVILTKMNLVIVSHLVLFNQLAKENG